MLSLGLSLWSVALGASWTPAALFGAGQAGHWAEYNPAIGLLFQNAAGTTPATLADQPVGLAKRLAGTLDASQAVALSRPTLARWPKGGRRNLLQYTEDIAQSYYTKTNSAVSGTKVSRAATGANGQVSRAGLSYPAGTRMLFSADMWLGDVGELAALRILGAYPIRADMVVNLTTGAVVFSYVNGYVLHKATVENLGGGRFRAHLEATSMSVNTSAIQFGPAAGANTSWEGQSSTLINANFDRLQLEVDSSSPYQKVVSQNDITETGKPDVWHLWNDGGDSLNAAPLPAGTYGLAYVDALGGVTVTTATSDGTTPINLLRAERQAEVILRQGAFTAAEETQIRSYWGGLYV